MAKNKPNTKLSGYIYFKPLTKKQEAAKSWRIIDLTPNKLYKLDPESNILDDVGSKVPIRFGIMSAHLGQVASFIQATRLTFYKAYEGTNELTVQAVKERIGYHE
jgi:hypothetical protein